MTDRIELIETPGERSMREALELIEWFDRKVAEAFGACRLPPEVIKAHLAAPVDHLAEIREAERRLGWHGGPRRAR